MKKKSNVTRLVRVPVKLVERVNKMVAKEVAKEKMAPLEERLTATLEGAKHGAWIHEEVLYTELCGLPLTTFLNRLGEESCPYGGGWSLAAMGPKSFVLRNRKGGRTYSPRVTDNPGDDDDSGAGGLGYGFGGALRGASRS